jgi:hypothetical protein
MIDKKTYTEENLLRIVNDFKIDYELAQKAFDIAATAIRINESKNLVDPNE